MIVAPLLLTLYSTAPCVLELEGNRSGSRVLLTGLAQSPLGTDCVRRWFWLRMADLAVAEGKAG